MRHLADIRPDALSYLKFFGLNGMWMVVPAISGYLLIQLTKDPHYNARTASLALFGKPDDSPDFSSTRDRQTAAR
jgi:hypothetical protein